MLTHNEPDNKSSTRAPHPVKRFGIPLLALINGSLYFAIARAGGNNLQRLFNYYEPPADEVMDGLAAMSALCYATFFYMTLEALALSEKKNKLQKTLASLAPFAACSFLTAGMEGSTSLGVSPSALVILIGSLLFALRMINCVDASVKFPDRMRQLRSGWQQARASRNYPEIARLFVTGSASVGYALSVTDPAYAAMSYLLNWMQVPPGQWIPAGCYTVAVLSGIGNFPNTLYWIQRGLRQLTRGGDPRVTGALADPTDRYTFLAIVLVAPTILGVLGSVTATQGHVFARLGMASMVIRVSSSVVYAACAGIPGSAKLLRTISAEISERTARFFPRCSRLQKHETTVSLIPRPSLERN